MYEFDSISSQPVKLFGKVLFFCTLWVVSIYVYLRPYACTEVQRYPENYSSGCSQPILLECSKIHFLFFVFRDSIKVYEFDGISSRPVKLFGKVLFFCTLWVVSNYAYLRALNFKGVLDVTALFATNSSFVYLLSWIILQKKFIAVRVSEELPLT